MASSFQPFLISEFRSGLFNYLEPWVRPMDAFEPLDNAYIYRGTLNKRNGYVIFGRMSYRDNNIALGNGTKDYTGTLAVHPIVAGSFSPTDGTETFTDNGDGTLTGSAGGTGTINYSTGAWVLHFNANVAANTNILATYTPNVARPIMGLKTWVSEADGSKKFLAIDTRRASVFNTVTKVFDPIDSISQIIWVGDNVTTVITVGTGWTAVAPYANSLAPFSVSVTDGATTIVDDGAGNFNATGNFAAGSTVNYATGSIHLATTVANNRTYTMTAKLVGDYFSSGINNFFNAVNWLAPSYYATNPGFLYLVNNVNRITAFDGASLSRPPFPITAAHNITFTNDITTALDLDVYKNRLLVQLPFVVGNSNPSRQSIRWSAINAPQNLVADVTGNGGELSAPTDDAIASSEFLRDQLLVFFNESAWSFKFTGSDFAPFRFDKLNSTKATNAPYGTVPYDERVTTMGTKGFIACDGVNVQRYDLAIIDNWDDINIARFAQCYGLRYDSFNQTWMLYPSYAGQSTTSDSAFIYNFLENTWAKYNIALSCLGLYYSTQDETWVSFSTTSARPTTWEQADFTWNSLIDQAFSPALMGGSVSGGFIYEMESGPADHPTSNSTDVAIESTITSTKWNPFTQIGQKVQFGYIDIYYVKNNDCTLQLTFFVDNSEEPATTRTLTLDGPTNSNFTFKRIFINVVGEFLKMQIYNNQSQAFKILGMVLWASQSGRLTPGRSVS